MNERFGICQWFHFEDYRLLDVTIETLRELGVRHLRTGLSWADYHRDGGVEWYDWQMQRLAESGLEVLLSVWHTPPSISLDPDRGSASVPPARTRDYADFIDTVIDRYGHAFDSLELWNEPNNPFKWDPEYDPDYSRYASLVIDAGHWARQCGKRTVLGGITLLDYDFVDRMVETGAVDFTDVVGIHAFPGMWEPFATQWDHPSHWYGWEHRVQEISRSAGGTPIWVTETGLATVCKTTRECRESLQVQMLHEALRAPAERVYWYSLFDLPPGRIAIEETNGAPREFAEYHMGLVRFDGTFRVEGNEKPAFHALRAALDGRPAGGRGERRTDGEDGRHACRGRRTGDLSGRTPTTRSRRGGVPADADRDASSRPDRG